jgi:nitroreductase
MDVIEAIYHRRAIREFTDAPVEKDQIDLLIDAAVHAPNAMDRQRWAFAVVRDRALLKRISDEAKILTLKMMGSAPHLAQFRDFLSSAQFSIFYDAPALIIVCGTEDDRFVDQDCCLAGQNLMLAAHAKGLGTCWIGFAEAWLSQAEAKKELGIPAHYRPIAPIIVGHPKVTPPAPPRHRPDVVWIGT